MAYNNYSTYNRGSDYPNISRLSFNSETPSGTHGFMSAANGRPLSSIVENGKDSKMERMSFAPNATNGSSPALSRKKSMFSTPWGNKKKKREEEERLHQQRIEEERAAEQAAFRQVLLEQKREMEELRNAQRLQEHQMNEERLRQKEEEEIRKQTELEYEHRRIAEANLRRRTTTREALRNLRELVRTRYDLDNEIYRMRNVRGPMRPEIIKKMQRADAVLAEIQAIVQTWEESPETWEKKEWELAMEVKARLLEDGKRRWENNPPWIDE